MNVGLTKLDLMDHQNAHDCAEEWRKARDGLGGISVSAWGAKWGDAIVSILRDPPVDESDLARIAEVEKDLTKEEERSSELRAVVDKAADALDKIDVQEQAPKEVERRHRELATILESAAE